MGNDREQRPNPDELLARVQAETARSARGRLKVFFGSSAGVGKTYAMLQAARAQRDAGVDVVVGYVETHGRAETEAQLGGLEVLPRLAIAYKGATLPEFDLDAALRRRPGLLLVDELAHTNAPGSRHAKRWQDVLELVESGVDVYTTVNVQHLESLNDVVAQITGVIVRETVPDSVLDQADEIELIDLPADELLRRLEEGKVYIADQAARAARNFFRPGNLIALREMALRRTAERVDAQMRAYRQTHSIGNTWPVAERLLVCVGPSPFSAQLVRATARLAGRLGAAWTAVFVETPEYGGMPEAARARVAGALRLAEQLGGNTITLTAVGVSAAVLHYARSSNVTTIVTGKPAGALWRRSLFPSLVDDLMRDSGDIEIHALRPPPEAQGAVAPRVSQPVAAKDHVAAMAVVAVCVGLSLAMREWLAPANLVMIYLLGVVAVSLFARRQVALLTAVVSVAAFDFFCVPPYLTFAVSDYQYLVTFGAMLTVGLTISGLTVKLRGQAARAIDRETRTQALYRFTRELAAEGEIFALARRATELVHEAFQSPAMIVLAERGHVHFRRRTTDQAIAPATEESIAQWAFDHGQMAGRGTDTLSGATALYLPLRGHGVLAIAAGPEQQAQLELFAYQTALALDRVQAAKAARESEVRIKTEEMRSGLLSAVSHDLRTPLASITGAATSLLGQGEKFSAETRQELLESIADEAERLGRLVNNLLEMTRLDSGTAPVARDWYSVEEIVGATLQRLTKILAKHPVTTRLPEDLPLVYVDEVLIGQVLANLLENAAKYTPAGTAIEIAASAEGDTVTVAVSDLGPGFAADDVGRVFEKFYRGRADGVRGVGLGLAIAQAIVTAHGGRMEAANRPEGGAQIRFTLAASAAPAP
jgi:two-component system sensor histidine kinase KdpD